MTLLLLGMLAGSVIGSLGTLAVRSMYGSRTITVTNSNQIPGAVHVDNPEAIQVKIIRVER